MITIDCKLNDSFHIRCLTHFGKLADLVWVEDFDSSKFIFLLVTGTPHFGSDFTFTQEGFFVSKLLLTEKAALVGLDNISKEEPVTQVQMCVVNGV